MALCYFGDMYLAFVVVEPGDAAEEVVDAQGEVVDCKIEEAGLLGLPPGGLVAELVVAPVAVPVVAPVVAPVVVARRQQVVVG